MSGTAFAGALDTIKSPLTLKSTLTVDGASTFTGEAVFNGGAIAPGIIEGLADPGTGVAIPVTDSVAIALTIGSAGAETNTVAIPTFLGQKLIFCVDVVGTGTRVVTFASAINVATNTIATFATARQNLTVEAIQLAGVLAWEVTNNNGTVVLS
jgi:hypothetical protein